MKGRLLSLAIAGLAASAMASSSAISSFGASARSQHGYSRRGLSYGRYRGNHKCDGKHGHIWRFVRYTSAFDYSVHPNDPKRFPDTADMQCARCGRIENRSIVHAKHRVIQTKRVFTI